MSENAENIRTAIESCIAHSMKELRTDLIGTVIESAGQANLTVIRISDIVDATIDEYADALRALSHEDRMELIAALAKPN